MYVGTYLQQDIVRTWAQDCVMKECTNLDNYERCIFKF